MSFPAFLLVAIFSLLATDSISTAAESCKGWSLSADFAREREANIKYRTSLDKYFAQYPTADCKPNPTPSLPDAKCVSTTGIVGLEKLPCFNYRLIRGKNKHKGFVVRMQGGPADLLTDRATQMDDYDVIAFNDIGVGDNSFPLKDQSTLKTFSFANQTELILRILKQEGIKDWVLQGNSYGSISATAIGSRLGTAAGRPKAVLLSGVVPDKKIRTQQSGVILPAVGADPDLSNCALRSSSSCSDGEVLRFLDSTEKSLFKKRLSEINTAGTPLKSLFRDALHWEFAQDPTGAAQFLKKFVLPENFKAQLACWYRREFAGIPWIDTFKTESQFAFYWVRSCGFEGTDGHPCKCIRNDVEKYDLANFQIKPPINIYYVNGDADSQTPLVGALSHFQSQKSPNKAFLKICGGGHMVTPVEATKGERAVTLGQILDRVFANDTSGFMRLPNFCSDSTR